MRYSGASCTYCGLDGEMTRDHLVPRRLVRQAMDAGIDLSQHGDTLHTTVPSCQRCNIALGCRTFETLMSRTDWVRARRGLPRRATRPLDVTPSVSRRLDRDRRRESACWIGARLDEETRPLRDAVLELHRVARLANGDLSQRRTGTG